MSPAVAYPATVTIPFRLVGPDPQVQLRQVLLDHGQQLCRALHPGHIERCRHNPSLTDVVEVRGLDDAGSATSILGAVIDTDRLSIRNGLPPVTLPDAGSPIAVQAAPQAVWKGDIILGRPVSRVVPIHGTGDLVRDKINLIEALVRSLGTVPASVEIPALRKTEVRPQAERQREPGPQDVLFGMPW